MGARTGNPAWVDSATEVEAQANPGRKITAAKLNAIEAAIDDSAEATHTHDDRYVRTVNNVGPDANGNVTVEGGGGASALDDLTDVDTSGQTTGDVLKYDGTTWVADAASAGTVSSTDISDSSAVGRSVLTAADAATARAAIGAGTSDFDGAYSSLSGRPTLGTAAAEDVGDFAAASHSHPVGDIDATGTADSTTFLRGDGTWAAPAGGGGSDPWTYQVVTTPTTNDSTTSVNISGLSVPDLPDGTYHFQWILVLAANSAADTAKATVGWSGTGVTVAAIGYISNGGESGSFVTPGHGNGHYATNSSSPTPTLTPVAVFQGVVTASGMSGEVRALLAAETNGKEVSAKAGSFVAYRRIGD